MRTVSVFIWLSFLAVAFVLSGCDLLGGDPATAIAVQSRRCIQDPTVYPVKQCLAGSELLITPYIPVWGDYYAPTYVNGKSITEGTVESFGEGTDVYIYPTTGTMGAYMLDNARAPAYWNLFFLEPWACGNDTNPEDGPIYQGDVGYEGDPYYGYSWWQYEAKQAYVPNYYNTRTGYALLCYTSSNFISPASTRFAILGSLPNSLTLTSRTPLTAQYGMPLLYVYDKTGSVVVTENATSVSSDGTQATFPFPSALSQSGYSLAMVNQTGGGVGFAPAGDNLLSIASSQTIPGSPFGVSVATQISETINCVYVPEGTAPHVVITTQCSQSSSNFTIPVVSLYSANQVLIGSRYVTVGLNPTAVVTPAYTAGETSNTVSNSNGYTTTIRSGSLRAIVANSGSNTISVLDTLNDALLYNVTVGNQPVALAVSSDNSTVYVANYTDSTVTQVNLTAGTATATVAVGGKPTSVAITSAGTLWVGGAGFLTEINTGTMSVVATEPIAGITILTLGFSNSVNELVATAIDSGGHVYADEISPGAFHAGGAYTPVASNMVSSLGTRLIRGAQLQAFTATLAGASTISSNQVGAPPLVV